MTNNKGITLIALVITIIILLILAGVTIIKLTQSGLFENIQKARLEHEKAEVKEELQLAVYSIQTDNASNFSMSSIVEKLSKEKNLDLDKLEWDSNQPKEQPNGVYKGYNFYISDNYEVILGEKIKINKENDILLEYSSENKNMEESVKILKVIDKTQNGYDAQAINMNYNDSKGIVFDGNSSYAVLDSERLNMTYPITITAIVKWENGTNNLLFIDEKSGIGIGTYNNQMILSVEDSKSNYYNLPEDFLNNEVNYITIVYNQNAADNELYINGQKLIQNSTKGSWCLNESGTYLGRRRSGSYFKGILYDFKIYNKVFSEQEIETRYNKEKNDYENNNTTSNEQEDYLILEYLCSMGQNEETNIPYIIKNKENNNYDIKLKNIEYDETRKGLKFDGTTSYGIIEDSAFEIDFPTTITIVAKSNDNSNNILFTNKASNIGIGLYQNKYIMLENFTSTLAKMYDINSQFLSNSINYITAIYENNINNNKLYLNGTKIESYTTGDGWNRNEEGTYLGRRNSGSYFNGILYKIKIYKKALSEDEIIKEYEKDKNTY